MINAQSGPRCPGEPDDVVTRTAAQVRERRPPCDPGAGGRAEVEDVAADPALWRRRLRHDIRHELGTIIMLASAVMVSDDVGPRSRERVGQLLGETRWLDHLLRQLDEDGDAQPRRPERIRADELVAEVVAGRRLATPHRVDFDGEPVWACVDALSLWRAVRNILDNACRVAMSRVDVRVRAQRGWICVQIDDDGPGFGFGPAGSASLGLGIAHDLISGYGGSLDIRRAEMGGAAVRILLPAAKHGSE
jgi:signal transduction histidine kinase